jgi:hypothetical protein
VRSDVELLSSGQCSQGERLVRAYELLHLRLREIDAKAAITPRNAIMTHSKSPMKLHQVRSARIVSSMTMPMPANANVAAQRINA